MSYDCAWLWLCFVQRHNKSQFNPNVKQMFSQFWHISGHSFTFIVFIVNRAVLVSAVSRNVDDAFCFHGTLSWVETAVTAVSNALRWKISVVCFCFFAEGLWRPSGVSGRGNQGDCGSQRPWQGLCPSQPAWHLHQCTFLYAVDTQSLQILPQPWVGPKTDVNPEAHLNLNLRLHQSSRALGTCGCYALLTSIAHGTMITFW